MPALELQLAAAWPCAAGCMAATPHVVCPQRKAAHAYNKMPVHAGPALLHTVLGCM